MENLTFKQEMENFPFDLEVVHERSIESENTYKTSLVETDANKSTAKTDNFFGEHKLISKKMAFNPYATVQLEKKLNISELDHKFTPEGSPYKEKIAKLEEKISSKDKLILQMKMYQNELGEAYEKLKAENSELRENCQPLHIESLKEELYTKESKISELKAKNQEQRKRIESLTHELSASKSQLSSTEKEKESISSKLRPLIMKEVAEKYEERIREMEFKHRTIVKRLEESLKGNGKEGKGKENVNGSLFSSQIRSNTKMFDRGDKGVNNKQYIKFAEAITDLMFSLTGESEKPSLKAVWRWIKAIFEEFLELKRFSKELEDIFQTSNSEEILIIIEDLLSR